ncbi:MAG: LysE family translocator [Rhodoluna sp.]|jgi:threonine/homoserine/homoserine lactone efflux protein
MSDLFVIGFFAGLALAIPVGPMAIMLINTTLEKGWRTGVAGASAMATVDFLYALTVFLLGHAVSSFFATWGQLLSLLGAGVLLWLGAATLLRNLRLMRSASEDVTDSKYASTPLKTFFVFAGATILNPPTALYFLGIAPSVAQIETDNFLLSALVFALGVFVGSVIWQQALALAGTTLRKFAQKKIRVFFGLLGGALIIALAVALAIRALQ